MGKVILKDLESLGVLVDKNEKHFFSPDFFDFLNNDFDSYLKVIRNFNKKSRSTAAFGSWLNRDIKSLMVDSLDNFLISGGEIDIFNPKVLFLKKNLDVTFQAAINYNHHSKSLFELWELKLLFSKGGFNHYIGDKFFLYGVSDLKKDDARFFSYQGRGDAKTFYSKFSANEISSKIGDYLKNVFDVKQEGLAKNNVDEKIIKPFFPSSKVVKSDIVESFNFVKVKSDYLKNYDEIYGGREHEHHLDLVDKPLVDKIKGVYEAFDLDKFKMGTEIPEDKVLFFLDVNFGKTADDFIPFITSKPGKAFIYHGGAPTDFFLKRIFSFKDKIYSIFKDEF